MATTHVALTRRVAEFDSIVHSAAASAAGPVYARGGNAGSTNIIKSQTNNSHMQNNSHGNIVNSGNNVKNTCTVHARSLDFASRSLAELHVHASLLVRRDLEARTTADDIAWLKAGTMFQMQQTDAIAAQTSAQANLANANEPNTCKCNCTSQRRRRDSLGGKPGPAHEVAIGAPDSQTLVVRLEPRCSLHQEQATGPHVYAGECGAAMTLNGRAIADVLQPTLELTI
ncbi:hypothetical protein K437DRAFT_85193 [Tilletiaria anomala UBC 951]|uniref:Uncharacterized protein n=1 Tax=Tilletiaria anomala (strain ATCC 24038 / CBS 436.72 / UBC 951) TaxID=1037660 RepID=A0A066V0J7_TILAU|nr:uncharacterized protein K437DRAFT_85193 [Tilletiaria anomala UBC 951]KDN34986.1 hypothetical protein K437DRAFT_85193 [Tilletiaria anomala UBC 951]